MDIFNSTTFESLEDSQPAINAQKRNVSQSKFRHIKTKYHYLRQLIYEGWTKMVKIKTTDQTADLATKVLSAPVTLKGHLSQLKHLLRYINHTKDFRPNLHT